MFIVEIINAYKLHAQKSEGVQGKKHHPNPVASIFRFLPLTVYCSTSTPPDS